MSFSRSTLDDIRSGVDLVALVGETVTLKKAGELYRGLCPFHDEKTGSFTVTPARGTWHCFGCEAHGDVFDWQQQRERQAFDEAVIALAARAGVTIPDDELPRSAREAERPDAAGGAREDDEASSDEPAERPGTDVDELDGRTAIQLAPIAAPRAGWEGPRFDRGTLGRAWAELRAEPATWARAVRQWALERRLGGRIADALPTLDDLAGSPIGGRFGWTLDNALRPLEVEAGRWVGGLRWDPYAVWIAVRTPAGAVDDIERRCIRSEDAPDGIKSRRLKVGDQVAQHTAGVLFGSIERAVEVAAEGGPVVIVEGGPDYAAAAACCAISGRGAVLGGVAHDGVRDVGQYLASAIERRTGRDRIEPGSFDVFVVPHVGDARSVGEHSAWSAGVRLLDVARVTWCPPERYDVDPATGEVTRTALRKGDLGDALAGVGDPVSSFWEMLASGRRMLEAVDRFERKPDVRISALQRWRAATDGELARAFYRLPLDEVIEFLHWVPGKDKEGNPTEPVRCRTVPHNGTASGATRVSRMAERWLAFHGVVFAAVPGRGHFAWDPLDRASVQRRERQVSRLVLVGGKEGWGAFLRRIGEINPKDPTGRVLDERLRQYAQESAGTELRSWVTADGGLRDPSFRVHLHTAQESVARVTPAGVVIEPNRRRSILVPINDKPTPIVWMAGIEPTTAGRLLWERLGQFMTLSDPERSLITSWMLLTPIRELFQGGRPFVWATGEKGAGKSFLAKLMTTLFYGRPKLGIFTSAARWEAARQWPLICDDNREKRFLGADDEEFLLTAATNTGRYRRSSGSDWGLVSQEVRAMVHLSAIGRPWNPELQRRALLVEHDRAHRAAGMREGEVIAAVCADRSALWSGVMRLYAECVMPRLAIAEHHRFADMMGQDHAQWGMREALGVMGVIGDVLASTDRRWGPGGAEQFDGWVSMLDSRAREAARHTDPLAAALDELLHMWNVTVKGYGNGEDRRPALDDGLYVCQPVYSLAPGKRESGRLRALASNTQNEAEAAELRFQADEAERTETTWTLHQADAELDERFAQIVVGFQGTYPQLHRDMMRAVQGARSMAEAFPSPDEIRHGIRDVVGWASERVKRKGPRGLRVYRWRQVDPGDEG